MKFIKENSYDIVKFFIYQIGIAVFALCVAIPLNEAVEEESSRKLVQLGVSILAILFYCILVYTVSWEQGATDRIRIDGGKIVGDPFKSAKLALLANIPNFVLSAFAIIAAVLFADGNAWTGVLAVILAILGLVESMYLGTVEFIVYGLDNATNLYYILKSVCFFVFPLIIVGAAQLGYFLGDKNIRIFGFASGNKKKNKK